VAVAALVAWAEFGIGLVMLLLQAALASSCEDFAGLGAGKTVGLRSRGFGNNRWD